MTLHFHNAMLEPDDEERSYLNGAYNDWLEAIKEPSYIREAHTARELIDALMSFASISHDDGECELPNNPDCGCNGPKHHEPEED